MQNSNSRPNPGASRQFHRPALFARAVLSLLLAAGAVGCATDNSAQGLQQGYNALESNQYDQAISRANEYLTQHPVGPGSAEALYLRGRGYEQRVAANAKDAQANLQTARTAYIDALKRDPDTKLAGYIHTSLANVAYFQDDYPTALQEWSNVYESLTSDDVRAWVLYRIALCHQRLGHFAEADRVFATVEQKFGSSIPAVRAKEKRGARGFSVQLATFLSTTSADTVIGTLRTQGVLASRQVDAKGRSVVMVGPVPTYAQAQSVRNAQLSKFPDAIIIP